MFKISYVNPVYHWFYQKLKFWSLSEFQKTPKMNKIAHISFHDTDNRKIDFAKKPKPGVQNNCNAIRVAM